MKNFIFLLFTLLFLSGSVKSQWVDLNGPNQGKIYSLGVIGTKIFAGTEQNGIYLSANSGSTWNAANTGLPASSYVSSIIVSDASNIFASTWGGGVFLTTNSGASWSAMNSGLNDLSVRTLIKSGTTFFAGTQGGHLYSSTNNCSLWNSVHVFPYAVVSISVSGSTIFIATETEIYYSLNNGTSWINTGSFTYGPTSIVLSGTNVIVGTSNDIYKTIDNSNWTTSLSGEWANTIMGMYNLCIFIGSNGHGLRLSINNGVSWSPMTYNSGVNSGLIDPYIYSFAVDGAYIYAGTSSSVYRKSLSSLTLIKEDNINKEIITFPNPVKNELMIEFKGNKEKINFEILNSLGQIVFNGEFEENIIVNTSNFASGIYELKLENGKYFEIKKIVIE